MSSSDGKPVYLEKVEAIKENACQACGQSANLVSCNTCTYAFHAKCLGPPLIDASVENWRCPECVANFEYIDENEAAALEAQRVAAESKSSAGNSDLFSKLRFRNCGSKIPTSSSASMAEPEMKKETSSTSSIMPDWSQLPEELLPLISTHLEKENRCFDVVHARSVCSIWRSTIPFPSSLLRQSYSFPTFPPSDNLWTFENVPIFLFILRATEYFMGGIGRDDSEDHLELLSPLQCSVKVKIPGSDPTLLKMLDCHILSLGHQYRMNVQRRDGVAFLPLDSEGKRGEFVVLFTYCQDLLVLTSAEMRWKPLEIENTSGDVCMNVFTCRGRFFANFQNGKVFVIDPYSLKVTPLLHSTQPVHSIVPFGNDEVFMVEQIVRNVPRPNNLRGPTDIRRFKYRVSWLDEKTGTWVEVKDLGNRVLFIGFLGNFSCLAEELPHGCGLSGNSILFTILGRKVTYAFKYGELSDFVGDDLICWRPSRENRVIIHNGFFPMVAFQVEC